MYIDVWKPFECGCLETHLGMWTFKLYLKPLGAHVGHHVGVWNAVKQIWHTQMKCLETNGVNICNIQLKSFNESLHTFSIQRTLHFQSCYPLQFLDIIQVQLNHHEEQMLVLPGELWVRDCPRMAELLFGGPKAKAMTGKPVKAWIAADMEAWFVVPYL